MKKIMLVLLSICFFGMVQIQGEVEMNRFIGEKTVTVYNSTRYQDYIVIYTQPYDRNNAGYEVLVDQQGFIVEKDVLVNLRPDTYIISVHGVHTPFLTENVEIGDKVVKTGDNLKFYRHLKDSNNKKIEILEKNVKDVIEKKKAEFFDVDLTLINNLNEQIAALKAELNVYYDDPNLNTYDLGKKVDGIVGMINQMYYATFEEYTVEGRALWHRPNASNIKENNLTGVKNFVKELYELGFNALFVETWWNGMTTYPSEFLNAQHPQMKNFQYGEYGNDYIKALIAECHKYDIEVHAWTEVLCGGTIGKIPDYIKQEWLCTDIEGNQTEIFLDPTNDEVQEFLKNLIAEMLEKYDFDGISYDYIRYQEATTYLKYRDTGFSQNSIQKFRQEYQYTGTSLQEDLKTDLSLRANWHSFKTKYITKTVKNLSNQIHNTRPKSIVSASPYGFIEGAKSAYMQDIKTWIEMGYLDLILPMLYSESVSVVQEAAKKIDSFNQYLVQYTGISPIYNGASVKTNQLLIEGIRDLNISGNALFASQNYLHSNLKLNAEIKAALQASSHKNRAITPTSNVNDVYNAWRELFMNRVNGLYSKGLQDSDKNTIKNLISKTEAVMKNPGDIARTIANLNILKAYAGKFGNQYVSDRIISQIDYIARIMNAAISRHLIKYKYWDIESGSARPDPLTLQYKEEIPGTDLTTTPPETTHPDQPTTLPPTTVAPEEGGCKVKKEQDIFWQIGVFCVLLGSGIYLVKRKP